MRVGRKRLRCDELAMMSYPDWDVGRKTEEQEREGFLFVCRWRSLPPRPIALSSLTLRWLTYLISNIKHLKRMGWIENYSLRFSEPRLRLQTEKVGSGSRREVCSIFYTELFGGVSVLIRKADVEETQSQPAFQSRIPSSRARFFCEPILVAEKVGDLTGSLHLGLCRGGVKFRPEFFVTAINKRKKLEKLRR